MTFNISDNAQVHVLQLTCDTYSNLKVCPRHVAMHTSLPLYMLIVIMEIYLTIVFHSNSFDCEIIFIILKHVLDNNNYLPKTTIQK